jgi:hypothetical protein
VSRSRNIHFAEGVHEVLAKVLADAGLEKKDVDGLAITHALSEAGNVFWTNIVAEALGLSLSRLQLSDIGGASAIGNAPQGNAASFTLRTKFGRERQSRFQYHP